MKKTIKILSFTFILMLCMAMLCFGASAANENGFLYSVSGGEATVTGFSEEITEALVIPSTLGGYPVTAIGDSAFEYQWDMPSVVVPEGVRTIGSQAFRCCYALEEVTLPSTLTFAGISAFASCEILRVNHPDLAKWVQIDFDGMHATPVYWDDDEEDPLTEIYFGDSTEPIRDVVIPEGVTRIGTWVFGNNETIESLVIPDSVTEIGERAFYDCGKLLTVDFGEGLERIGEFAFDGCENLGNFTLPDSLLTIGDWAFSSNTAITEVTVPDKVEVISLGAFSYCKALETVNIGAGVETIGQQAFYRAGLTEVIIPDNVIAIDLRAFQECKELETVVIGDGVTTVADKVFYDCTALKNLTIGDSLTSYPENFLKLQDKKESDYIPDDWLHIEKLTVGDGLTALPTEVIKREYLKEIVIGDGITEIAAYQFTSFSKLEKVVLGDNIRAIGTEAFYRCTALNELKLPANLEAVGNRAFCVCSALTEIVIPAKAVSLGESAFGACSSAESVTFEGNALRTIGDGAFSECSALTAIAIPEGVTHLGSSLFYWSENLREITLPDSLVSIKSGLIYYTPYDDDYDYDEDMLYIGNHLINGGYYSMPAKYVVRKGTKSIAQYAFSNEHSLETVVIHKGLVSMDDDIFNDCPNLTKIGFTGTEAEWNAILKGNNDFSAYDIEFNYYVCPHENTENREAVAPGCDTYGYTEGVYCNDCDEWIKGHRQLAMSHKDNNGDAVCDDCQAVVSDIVIGEYKTVGSGDFEDDLTFVAPATGKYTIVSFSEGVIDPTVGLYDSEYAFIDGNDEQDNDYNNDNYDFSLTCTLEKGKTYHFIITTWCEGNFQVLLTFDCEHTGGTATCNKKAECTICGMEYGSFAACNYEEVVTKATTSKNGKIETKCSACGDVSSTKTIAKISSVTLSNENYIYDGKNKTPKVTVKDADGKTLVKNTDYKLSVASKRSGIGRYTVKVTFIGNYSGTKSVYFYIKTGKPATVKSASQTTSSVKLSWSAVPGASGYTVYRYSPSKKAYVKAGTTEGTSLTVSKLYVGTKYTFRVVSYGKTTAGKVYDSDVYALLKTATKTKTPELTKVTTTKGKAYVYHSDVSGETGYTVYYSTKKDSGFKKYANFKADTTRCDITGLTSGKTYYFKVRTYIKTDSGYVYSAWSAVKSVKIK